MIRQGDFLRIDYKEGKSFYTEKDFSDVVLSVRGGLDILSDDLRYQMRKDGIDLAYTAGFMRDTAEERLDTKDVSIRRSDDQLLIYFPQFQYELMEPLSYGRQICGRDFGFTDDTYRKHRYVDPRRPMIALTYDDGPYWKVDDRIYDVLKTYDARATFFIVGSRLSSSALETVQEGIDLGMEFGSHTENHEDLSKLDAWSARETMLLPADYVFEKLGYEMKTYRPPYGSRNHDMESMTEMKAILWNLDSLDWKYRDADISIGIIKEKITDKDVVLMHSLYESTAEATEKLVPALIDMGYQLVTVSELMEYLGVEDKAFYGK